MWGHGPSGDSIPMPSLLENPLDSIRISDHARKWMNYKTQYEIEYPDSQRYATQGPRFKKID